ncbi:hypothetical protein [Arthrobacter psychrolactophilus]
MRTNDQAGDAERTAAHPADIPSVERRAAEFTARRRGAVRKYFHAHPRIMDVVVVLSYLAAGTGLFVAGNYEINLAVHLAMVMATATVLMFRRDRPLAVLAILSVFEIIHIIMVPSSGNIGASLWFALYAVAVRYRSVVSFVLAVHRGHAIDLLHFLLLSIPGGIFGC